MTAADQHWVADITYVRLEEEFVYLVATILDAYSRRVIGWSLGDYITDELTIAALRMALSNRTVCAGLVHHSDRGSQHATRITERYWNRTTLTQHESQSEPLGNGECESQFSSLIWSLFIPASYAESR